MYDHSASHHQGAPLDADQLADLRLRFDLVGALGRGEFEAYFQPQWDAVSEQLVAFESLCRWHHPRLGMIPPTRFIAMSEDMDTIHEIGVFMMEAACSFAAHLQDTDRKLDVAINMSVAQLATDYAGNHLLDVISDHSLDPARITVEVTESLEIVDLASVVARLEVLRAAGIGVSIDDFGMGHSSEEQVLSLPVTEVKVDRSIVQSEPGVARSLIRELVALASEHSLRTVAEGVETREQLEIVRDEGCDRVQGYLLGRPVPRAQFELDQAGRTPR